ncbi:MAG: hypothetical protein KGR22_04450 [Planctomycetes bacterium]|nr:hypothetical protein [Planctomycetota bacterium]
MKKNAAKPTLAADLAAVLRLDGERWKALLVRFGPLGVQFEQAGEFGPDCGEGSGVEDLAPWLLELMPERVVVIVPGNEVILRSIPLPRATPAQQQQALALQAEGALAPDAPRCRSACAVVPDGSTGAEERLGIVLEWKPGGAVQLPAGLKADDGRRAAQGPVAPRVTFTAPVAGLLGLMSADGLGRAARMCIDVQPSTGSVAVVASREGHLVARTLIERSDDASEFAGAISEAVNDTAMLGHWSEEDLIAARRAMPAAFAQGFAGLAGADALGSALAGAPDEASWRAQFGDLAGVALALRSPLAPLLGLMPIEPRRSQGLIIDALTRMDSPAFTKRALIAAGLAVVFGPMAVAGLRLAWLNFRLSDAAAFEAAMVSSERRIALYGQVDKLGWPMSKLLSDIACTTPDGIELESINIDHGSNVQVRGLARGVGDLSSVDAIVMMEERMRASKVFARIVKSWEEPKGGSTEFSITAQVTDPMLIVRYSESQDFGKKTLAEQRWGPVDSDGFLIEAGSAPAAPAVPAPTTPVATGDPSPVPAVPDMVAGGAPGSGTTVVGGGTAGVPSTPSKPVGAAAAAVSEAARAPVAAAGEAGAAPAGGDAAVASNGEGSTEADADAREGRGGRRGGLPGASNPTEASRRGRPAVGAAQPAEQPIPPALTQDQVDAMSRDEARDMLIKIAGIRQRDGLDEETSARLKKDFDMLKARTRKP